MEKKKKPTSNICNRYRPDVCFLAGHKKKELKIPAGQLKTYVARQNIAGFPSNTPDEGRLKMNKQEYSRNRHK